MNTTIVIYGSSTGTCEAIAEKIASKLGCKALNVQELNDAIVEENQNLILGTSTWGGRRNAGRLVRWSENIAECRP